MPILISRPEDMYWITLVVPRDFRDVLMEYVHRSGVLHLAEVKEEVPAEARKEIENEITRFSKLLEKLNSVIALFREEKVIEIRFVYSIDEELKRLLPKIEKVVSEIEEIDSRLRNLARELDELHSTYEVVYALRELNAKLRDLDIVTKYVYCVVVCVPKSAFEGFTTSLAKYLRESVIVHVGSYGEKVFAVIAGSREDYDKLLKLIEELGGKLVKLPKLELSISEYFNVLSTRIKELQELEIKLRNEISSVVENNIEDLVKVRELLLIKIERLRAILQLATTQYLNYVRGWVPVSEFSNFTRFLEESKIPYYISYEVAKDAPTKMRNPRAVKPFELLTKLYGVPRYGDWDPTPVLAYSFTVFYGLMLCDVVYGAGLLIAALFVLDKLVENPESEGFKLFKRMLMIAAISAMVFGVLSGTYLGDPSVIIGHEVNLAIVKQMTDPGFLIALSLLIGLLHVDLAHALAMRRAMIMKNWGLAINKMALFLLQLFGIPYVITKLLKINLPLPVEPSNLVTGIYLALGLLILSHIITNKGMGVISWVFDLTGLLGDVLSYCRIAGLALSTYYLARSMNIIGSLLANAIAASVPVVGLGLGIIVATALLIPVHILFLALSAIGCFAHSLRLCFVEFLTKFYEGGGIEYTPLKITTVKRIHLKPSQ